MKISMIMITVALSMTVAQPVLAAGGAHQKMTGHRLHVENPCAKMEHKKEMFLVKKEMDGFTVSFHVMKAKEGKDNGGSHNLMVKVEKDGSVQALLAANSKVTHPNGSSQSKKLTKKGDWYTAAYDLGHEGSHQLMVKFKTSDGQIHGGGVYYPEKESSEHGGHDHGSHDH